MHLRQLPQPFVLAVLVAIMGSSADRAHAAETPPAITDALKVISAVAAEGAGNDAAAKAWKSLVGTGAAALLPTLSAFDSARPSAANWLRTAVDAIAEGEARAGRPLPLAELTAFLLDDRLDPTARRIAYELIASRDKVEAEKLLPKFLSDPSLELRRDAIQQALDAQMKAGKPDAARLGKLFQAARDKDQVEALAKQLRALGQDVDITRHYGYITEWQIVGPFPNPPATGFAAAAPPESHVDIAAKYVGNKGPITWKYAQSDAGYGTINLNAELGKHKDSCAYAHAVIVADAETAAEIRATSNNAVRIFFNGKLVFEREEYHHGTRMDQHAARVTLKKGKNEILVKVCQNNQTDSWAQDWSFAARVCDATGGALPVKQLIATAGGETRTVELGAKKPPAAKKADK